LLQLLTAETLVEALNTSAGVDQLLLTSVERMALGANFDVDLGLGGTSLDDVAACAGDGAVNVVRMDTLFHSFHLISGSDLLGPYLMYVPITTFNIGYPWEWAFRLPQDGCFPQKQPSEPEFQDKAYLHRI
jgi:hypothetical protein